MSHEVGRYLPDLVFETTPSELVTLVPEVRRSIAELREKWCRVRDGLLCRDLLTEDARALTHSVIVVEVIDQREDRSTPLPQLLDEPQVAPACRRRP
jgi:hypothetical protein